LFRSKSDVKTASSAGLRISCSFEIPLEMMIGTWNAWAIVVSLRKLDNNLAFADPSSVSNGFRSTSSDARLLEANSASAMSKKRPRKSISGKFSKSTRRSLAACLATFFVVHMTLTISNFLLSLLRLLINSSGVLGLRSTRVAKSILASAQTVRTCSISSVALGVIAMATKRYPSAAALCIKREVCLMSSTFGHRCRSA